MIPIYLYHASFITMLESSAQDINGSLLDCVTTPLCNFNFGPPWTWKKSWSLHMLLVKSCWTLLLWRPISNHLELNLNFKTFDEVGKGWATTFFVMSGEGQSKVWTGGVVTCLVGVLAPGLKHQDKAESGPTINDAMDLFHYFVNFWELLSVYLLKQLSGIIMTSVGVDRSVCVDYTNESVWGVLSRRVRWLPTISSLLFSSLHLLLFSLSIFSSFSPLFQLPLLWFKPNFRIKMVQNIPRKKQVSAARMFIFTCYFIWLYKSN